MFDQSTLRDDAAVRRLLYLCVFLFLAIPAIQSVTQLWPLQVGNIQWRFTAATIGSTALVLPSAGMVLWAAVARATGNRAGQLTLGILSTVLVVALLAGTGNFVLDALQLREIVPTGAMSGFLATAARILLLCTLFIVAFTWVAVTCFTGRRPAARVAAPRRARPRVDEGGLVMAD
jgi:hypothetical protein